MTNAQKIALRLSEVRSRLNEISGLSGDDFEAVKEEADGLRTEYSELEERSRLAIIGNGDGNQPPTGLVRVEDAETRELRKLRGKVSIGRYLSAGIEGARVEGAEEEFRQAVGAAERTIPLDAFEVEERADVATSAPSVTGINLQPIVPAAFSQSIAARVGIGMPRAPSGAYSVPRLTTSLTASTEAKGDAVESTAGAFTSLSTKSHRGSARVSLRAEDLADVGLASFAPTLRSHLRLVLADLMDSQLLLGDNSGSNINGLLPQLTDDDDPTAIVSFPSFVADMASQIDGKWAGMLSHLRLVTNATVFAKLASSFQDPIVVDKGTGQANSSSAGGRSVDSALDWGNAKLGGLWCNSRMPAAASNISACLVVRAGMLENPEAASMPAVCPTWGDLAISDPFSDSASATTHFTLHVLIGDVLVRVPDVYREVRIKSA